MGKVHPTIDAELQSWITAQRLFFVATAPSGSGGHVNCSPKGGDSLRVLGPTTVAYLDRTGSGIETVAHVRDNGRIVVMFMALDGAPRIVRLHGRGRAVAAGTPEFAALAGEVDFSVRAIVVIEAERISDSCGFGVPRYRYEGEREQLGKWADKKGRDGVAAYVREKNAVSIDGLPGLPVG
jgi:predicted pyridoxine 5'-phosphate oxidase superfamily flavin-nucleotide-binding protein